MREFANATSRSLASLLFAARAELETNWRVLEIKTLPKLADQISLVTVRDRVRPIDEERKRRRARAGLRTVKQFHRLAAK